MKRNIERQHNVYVKIDIKYIALHIFRIIFLEQFNNVYIYNILSKYDLTFLFNFLFMIFL